MFPKKKRWLIVAVILLFPLALVLSKRLDLSKPNGNLKQLTGRAEQGAYLARVSGCITCHTNFEQGGAPLAGGQTFDTEFGSFTAPNLTTDSTHGIGGWSIEDFDLAVRQGLSPKTGKPYYPVFPYTFYVRFSDQDIVDLWSAFQTVPPVAEASQSHSIRFPFNLRFGLYFWRALYFKSALDSQSISRGEYLVEVAGHCAACHSPRNFLGGLKSAEKFTGADNLPGGGKSPAITKQALLQSGWTKSDLSYALSTGIKPDGDVIGDSMGEVIRYGTSFMSRADLDAMSEYLLNN